MGRKSSGKVARRNTVKWTELESARIKEIIDEHWRPGKIKPAVQAAIAEFPDKSETSVKTKVAQMHYEPSAGSSVRKMEQVEKLVDTYGEDWERIGAEIGVSARIAHRIWSDCKKRRNWTSVWTKSEIEMICNCIKDGIGLILASKTIGTKSIFSCAGKISLLKQLGKYTGQFYYMCFLLAGHRLQMLNC
ncbi:hypothetical protein H4R24_002324 [Coemansia sp. RSA 988]|nr:hypothetical protein H4R24_002324 [Coemansia sp. RSA 988]